MKTLAEIEYDNAVNKLRGLLADWLNAGVELFLEMRKVDESGVWKAPGHASFTDFLKAEFPAALGIERYNNVIRAIDLYGVNHVRKWGIELCHTITPDAIASNPQRINDVKKSLNNHIDEHGCAPDRNTARDIALGIAPELRKPHRTTRKVRREETLEREFRESKADLRQQNKVAKQEKSRADKLQEKLEIALEQVAELKQEVKSKDKEIRALRRKLSRCEGPSATV